MDFYRTEGIEISVTIVGNRPCGAEVEPESQKVLMERARPP